VEASRSEGHECVCVCVREREAGGECGGGRVGEVEGRA
jgi:hypothetical protein